MVDATIDSDLDNLDIAAILISLLSFTLYHVYLYIIAPAFETRDPGERSKVPYMLNQQNVAIWIDKHKSLHDTKTTTLAVYTLKNAMIVASFLGGNSLLLALNLSNEYENVRGEPRQIRSIIIISSLFGSFLCWANVLRLASQSGYLLGSMQHLEDQRDEANKVAAEAREKEIENQKAEALEEAVEPEVLEEGVQARAVDATERLLPNSAAAKVVSPEEIPDFEEEIKSMIKMLLMNFSFGFRLIFLSLPFAMYIAGPIALLTSMFILLVFFQQYDFRYKHTSSSMGGLSELIYRKNM